VNDSPTNEFGNRLDRLASQATRDMHLASPAAAGSGSSVKAPVWAKLGGAFAVLALLVGGIVAVQRRSGSSPEDVTVGDGDPADRASEDYCPVADVLPVLQSGLPTYDYQPAGSFAALADQANVVVTGTISEVVRTQTEAEGFTELTVADAAALDGEARPDITIIAYDSFWPTGAGPDPIAEPMLVEDVDFIAFLSPWSGRRGDWAPGVEGLYVACGTDSPIAAVIENAAGPSDPTAPTIADLVELLLAPIDEPTPTSEEPAVAAGTIDCAIPGAAEQVVALLGNGVPDSSQGANSFAELAEQSDAVATGTLTSVSRLVANPGTGETYTVLQMAGIESVDGRSIADLTAVSFVSQAPSAGEADPLAEAVMLDGVDVVAFVHLDRTFPGGLRVDGLESLYVACGTDAPATPASVSVAGPDDPADATLAQIIAIVAAAPGSTDSEALLPAAEAIRDAMLQFANGEDLAIEEIPLDTEVALALGQSIEATRTNTQLRDPATWTIERDEFEGFAGPFSALDVLAGLPDTAVTIGDHPRCVADPTPAPTGFEDLVRLSIQPAESTIDSCLQWYAVDLFYDPDAGTIVAISLDLFGP
jgi:hypothetical protein